MICEGGYNASGNPMVKIRQLVIDGGGFSLLFSLNGVLSPITNQPINYITIQSFQANEAPVDTCIINPIGVIPRLIQTITVTSLQPAYPSSLISISLQIYLPDTLQQADTILLDFSTSYSPSFNFVNITGSYVINVLSRIGNQIIFTFNHTQSRGVPINIVISSIRTSPSISSVTPFSIQVLSYGYQKMIGNFKVPTIVSVLTNISLVVQNLMVGASSKYTLNFIMNQGALGVNSIIRVYFPDFMIIHSNVKVYCRGVQLNVRFINNTKCLQLTNFVIPPNNTITLIFSNLTNLNTTSPTSISLLIITYLSSTLMDQIAQGTLQIPISYSAAPTLRFTVRSSSAITYQHPINMTFNITNRIPVTINSSIHILYYNIQTHASTTSDSDIICWVNGLYQNCIDKVINSSINQRMIIIQINSTDQGIGMVVDIQDWFINTGVTKAISYFNLQTYTQQGYRLQYTTIPVYLTDVTQARATNYFILYSRTNTTNSAPSTYIFIASQPQPLITTSNTAVITFPTSLNIQSSSCQSCYKNPTQNTISFDINSTFLQLKITNIINSYNTQPINNISISIVLDSIYVYSRSNKLNNYISNTQNSILNISNVVYTSYIYGTVTSVSFNIVGIIGQPAYIVFMFPRQYGINNITCTTTGVSVSTVYIINSTVTVYMVNYTSTNIGYIFSNVVLPMISQSLPIVVTTYTANNYSIGSGSLPLWMPICSLPCLTCTSVRTQCLSCFQNNAIATQNLHDSISKKCVDQCTQSQVQINLTCIQCSTSCQACSVSTSNCTSCGIGKYLYQNQCMTNCPPYYYKLVAGRICQPCIQPCQTCVNTIQCITCRIGWYLYNQKCIIACPASTTVPDLVNRKCIDCSPQCLTCSTTYRQCTSCNDNFAMQNGTCVSQCSNGLYIYNSQCVSSCKYNCLTCSIYATYCLTCPPSRYLYNNSCVTECPSMYYIAGNSSCQPCTNLAINCKYCQSLSICLICDIGYVLFEQQCLNYTPTGYANVSGVAIICNDNCVTCDTFVNNCTSCRYLYYHNGNCIAQCPVSHYKYNHTCLRCNYPCNTCTNQSTCLSCIGNIGLFYNQYNMTCVANCPQYYYGNVTLAKCFLCRSPCLMCQSLTTCTSCVNNTFLYNGRCINACPAGYFPNQTINKCIQCNQPCDTCTTISPDSCINCINNYFYFYPNSCVPTCPANYVTNYIYRLCQNCTAPCLVCSQTQCFKCSSAFVLYGGRCVNNCPSTHYPQTHMDATRDCALCPAECQTCSNSSFCILCAIGYFWQNLSSSGICVSICPPQRPILSSNGCQPCQDQNCTACYSNNQCYQCQNISILFQGFCINQCPPKYFYNQSIDSCQLIPPPLPPKNQTNETNITIIQVNLSVTITLPIPMIFTIAGGGLSILTFIFSLCIGIKPWLILVCAWALSQVGVIFVAGYAYHKFYVSIFTFEKLYGFVMVSAAALFVTVTIFVFFYSICKVILQDERYRRWRKSATCAQLFYLSFCFILTIINFKFQHLIWNGMKSAPKLSSVIKLRYLSISSAISLISSISLIVVYIFLINQLQVLLMIWIDSLVVLVVSALLSVMALKRNDNFFQQVVKDQDGDVILHRRHVSGDQFLTTPMKGTQRQQFFGNTPTQKQLQSYSSQYESNSQISSRLQLRSSSRAFLSSRTQSLNQSIHSQPPQTPRHKNQFNIQCSILSSGIHESSQSQKCSQKKYYIQCEYEHKNQNSNNANMGSMQQSKQWNGIVNEVQYYKQQYNLNKAVILDQRGMKMELWDISSNQAVLQEQIGYENVDKKQSQCQSNLSNDNENILQQLNIDNKRKLAQQQQSVDRHNDKVHKNKKMMQDSNMSIVPIIIKQKQQPIIKQQKNNKISIQKQQQLIDKQQKQQSIIVKYSQLLKKRIGQYTNNNNNTSIDIENQTNNININSHQQILNDNINNSINISNYKNQIINNSISINSNSYIFNKQISIINNRSLNIKNINKDIHNVNQNYENNKDNQDNDIENKQDRFDNSVLSNHQGQLQISQQQYMVSERSNHQGSMQSIYNAQSEQQNQQAQSDQQQQANQQIINQNSEQININIEDQQQRWEFLLQDPNIIKKRNKMNRSAKSQKNKTINQQNLNYDLEDQYEEAQNQQYNQSQNQGQEKGLIQLQRDGKKMHKNENQVLQSLKSSNLLRRSKSKKLQIIGENSKEFTGLQINQHQNKIQAVKIQKSNQLKKSKLSQKSKTSKNASDKYSQKISNLKSSKSAKKAKVQQAQYEQGRQDQSYDQQSQYLQAKAKIRQPKTDDHNKFTIKTKRKKRNDPKHKVVIVDNKKFVKLKRQASQLQKQIQEGEKLKNLIAYQQSKNLRRSKSKQINKNQQLKAIYMKPSIKSQQTKKIQ